ncbi:rCG42755 [Rattus norvegicus]|uniref:RCG42755 n=1 Tax=Rattus norvegicus TaxID=10116 RepID=A6K195_RAT|nr:rCG42755 [Rattus norvegicus]
MSLERGVFRFSDRRPSPRSVPGCWVWLTPCLQPAS